jgi:hypothetical protein
MQAVIYNLLPPVGDFLDDFHKYVAVTSGATVTRPKRAAKRNQKISGRLVVSKGGKTLVQRLLELLGVQPNDVTFVECEHNVVTFVTKNWKTDRTIAMEPDHLLPLQAAIGEFFKRLLRKWGVDLSDQTMNQVLARIGSIDGSYATIDLKAASDTIARALIKLLFPPDWAELLLSLSSSSYAIGHEAKSATPYAKLSSMGNGFTFPVESIIFAAAILALKPENIWAVYGDDIVVETRLASELTTLLRVLGFEINTEKSFSDPSVPFRESCGADWLRGKKVTPFYVRSDPFAKPEKAHILNGLFGIAVPDGALWNYLLHLQSAWKIPVVPFQEDSRCGLHVPAPTARRLDVLHYGPCASNASITDTQSPWFRGYCEVTDVTEVHGWQPYCLWALEALKQEDVLLRPGYPVFKDAGLLVPYVHKHGLMLDFLASTGVGLACFSEFALPHKRRVFSNSLRYVPPPQRVPSHLWILGDQIEEILRRTS